MVYLGDRIINGNYRGLNFWKPHWPLCYINTLYFRRDVLWSIWKENYVYTLGVL